MSVMSNAVSFVSQTLRYKGREGHWAWILHRAAGVGVFVFLALHIFDIFLVGFGPEPFNTLAIIYHHPLARIGHIFLFFGVLFHAINGVRITILDFWPQLWKYQRQSVWIVAVIFLALFIPSTIVILVDAFSLS
jgi:succinate dehydrogenase / fumarate reductase cytochrome b subunit